jgi:hypothetical protein
LTIKLYISLILLENLLLEDLMEMLDLPEEKLLLIPMEDGVVTVEVLSQEKTLLK